MYWMSAMTVSASSCRFGRITCNRRRTCATVIAAAFFPQMAALADQEVMCQQRHRHVMVPAAPRAYLIVVHPQLALAFLNRRLHWPAHAALAYQCRVWRRGWRIRQVRFQLRPLAQAAPQHQPLVGAWQPVPHQHDPHERELGGQRPLGALLDLIIAPPQRAI